MSLTIYVYYYCYCYNIPSTLHLVASCPRRWKVMRLDRSFRVLLVGLVVYNCVVWIFGGWRSAYRCARWINSFQVTNMGIIQLATLFQYLLLARLTAANPSTDRFAAVGSCWYRQMCGRLTIPRIHPCIHMLCFPFFQPLLSISSKKG